MKKKLRDDITYQEALALGLQNEDLYIKRRLRMKLGVTLYRSIGQKWPTQSELKDYLERHAQDFTIDSQLAFSQIYFSPTHHSREQIETQIETLKEQLNQDGTQMDIEQLGDPTLLASYYPMMSVKTEYTTNSAKHFQESTDTLGETGQWAGPIRSQYGYHLVKVEQRIPSYVPDLSEVRLTVERGVISERL
ncbi:peptidylprolyl isomerase [Vibrio sp. M60_M31a]